MTDVDEAILATLDQIVAAAPPPVPAESIPAIDRSGSGGFTTRRRLALVAAVALMAGMGIGAAAVISVDSSTPEPAIQVETVDDPAENNTSTPTTTAATGTSAARQSTTRVAVAAGGWLSEIVPQAANQLPGLEAEELWTAMETTQPRAPFNPGAIAMPADAVDGMSNDRLRWEGLLLEAGYTFDGDPDAAEVIDAMHAEFLRVTDELGYDEAMAKVGYSPYEVVAIASLIEAEATVDADRPKVARVIYNRLAEGLPVGIDSSLVYAAQDRDLAITAELLDTPGPYNLRHPTAVGLLPTPIGTPSVASLEAAINPADGPWLFFAVADEAGTLAFAGTLEEHSANVAAAREKGLLD